MQAAHALTLSAPSVPAADLAFDLDEVEVERLREAPPSAARGGEGEGLAARLQAVRELGLQPLGALTSPAEHSEQGSAGPLSPLSTNPAGIGLKVCGPDRAQCAPKTEQGGHEGAIYGL